MAPTGGILQRVADAVVEGLGFGVAVVNVAVANVAVAGDVFEVVAVAGSAEARETLLGSRNSRDAWQALFDESESWGLLRFHHHDRAAVARRWVVSWTPGLPVPSPREAPEAWHPDDALFAPLYDSAQVLLGVLSVDVPPGAHRPSAALCRSLEALAITAALAIEQATLHQRARASERLLRTLLDSSPLGLALLDQQRRPITVNPAFVSLAGDQAGAVVAAAFSAATVPARTTDGGGRDGDREVQVAGRGAASRWLRVRLVELAEDSEQATHLVEVEDVTERRRAARRLRFQAEHDALTGLPNRSALLDQLARALVSQVGDGRPFAALYCDLDRFKPVNDTHGHPIGDAYLQAVASRLQGRLRDGDVLGRFGGDEFVVVTAPLESVEVVAAMADRLVAAVAETLRVDDLRFVPSISIGVALVEGTYETADQVLRRADSALYEAKRAGGGAWRLHGAD